MAEVAGLEAPVPHEVVGDPELLRELERAPVEGLGSRPRADRGLNVRQDSDGGIVGAGELLGQCADRQRAGLVAQVPVQGRHVVEDHGLPGDDAAPSGPDGARRARSLAGQGEVGEALEGARLPTGQRAEKDLLVPPAHAHQPLVSGAPRRAFHAAGQLELGHPLPQRLHGRVEDHHRDRCRRAHLVELERGLHRPDGANRGRDIDPLDVLESRRDPVLDEHGDHIQLESDSPGRSAGRRSDQGGQLPVALERDDLRKRAIPSRPLENPANRVDDLAGCRNDQHPVLHAAGEVEEIDVLGDQGGVQRGGPETTPQRVDPALNFVLRGRRHSGAPGLQDDGANRAGHSPG